MPSLNVPPPPSNFSFIETPRWLYILWRKLTEIGVIDHDNLGNVAGVDVTSTDTEQNKHVSNANGKKWENHVDATSNVHGVTGTFLGSDNTATLTNKTISGLSNTLTNLRHGTEVDSPSSGVHGVSGSIVGTTDSQTLTNKTMAAGSNTFSGFLHGSQVDNPSSGIHGVTGSVVGTSDSQTLSNKTLTTPIINGVTDGSSAGAGVVGEELRSAVAVGSAIALTTTEFNDVTSLSITAGDWDLYGVVCFTTGGALTATNFVAGFSTTSGNFSTGLTQGDNRIDSPLSPVSASSDTCLTLPQYRITISSTTTYYLKCASTFAAGSVSAYGRISARRRR